MDKSTVMEQIDKTIVAICIRVRKTEGLFDVGIIKALTDLIEVRASIPDWREKQGASTPD